jgi:hypothetical protein
VRTLPMHTVSERRTQVPVPGLYENDIFGSWLQVWYYFRKLVPDPH